MRRKRLRNDFQADAACERVQVRDLHLERDRSLPVHGRQRRRVRYSDLIFDSVEICMAEPDSVVAWPTQEQFSNS